LTGVNLAGGSLGVARDVGRDLGIALLPDLGLWLEAGLTAGSAKGTMFQSLSTTIETLGLATGVAVRYRLLGRLAASARVAVGAQRARVAIDASGMHAYDHAWGATASAAAALDLHALVRPRFGFGVRVEAGYVAAQRVGLTPHSDSPDDTLALAMTGVALGGLDLSGPSVALSLLGQF
jgi:hypothetical protein